GRDGPDLAARTRTCNWHGVTNRKKESGTMNWDQLEGKWKQTKGSVKERWGRLTDDDLDVIAGKRDKLIGKLQERYGIAREEAARQSEAWCRNAVAEDVGQRPVGR